MTDGNLIYAKIIFLGNVIDNQDPMMLGRIRASAQTDNVQSILGGIPDWNPQVDPWGPRDPFLFLPFLPFFVSQVPKPDELIQIIYQNPRIQYKNQFYIQGPYSSALLSSYQFPEGANANLGTGAQYTPYPPIKNNDGSYKDKNSIGVYPEPTDNALLGRGSADVIVKQDEVLIRAGKSFSKNPFNLPVGRNERAFIQLSQFTQTKNQKGFRNKKSLDEIIQSVKFLIEYNLLNPENRKDTFRAEIYVYTFSEVVLTSEYFTILTDFNNRIVLKNLINVGPSSMQEVITKINTVLQDFNDNTNTPFFFRPNSLTAKYLDYPPDDRERINVQFLYDNVKPNAAAKINGSGLVFWKNAYGVQTRIKKTVEPIVEYTDTPQSIVAFGGDILYLLSHNSQIPGKAKVNLNDTLYGINQERFSDEIINTTSSMVRGEELLKLVNLIVRFMIGHVHPYHGMPPNPLSTNGVSIESILSELQQASDKILNNNIRIN